jgi:1-deoxy-D-xylulose-5-phosphate reductoisomerase
VVVGSQEGALALKTRLSEAPHAIMPEILVGEEGLNSLAADADADTVVVGLVGFIGLEPTLKALEAGKQVLTANKETFVVAGHLVQPYLHQIIPLDSEHSAIYQCLQGSVKPAQEVRRLYLTASGGPFRQFTKTELENVTVAQALNHPNWTMGEKVTIDSATMMNKGLEIIEAHHLFGVSLDKIEVVIHPESIVHSAVAFVDGSVIAQMGQPDMRVPLQYGLTAPERWSTGFESLHLDLTTMGTLQFFPADPHRFPCLRLARQAAEIGGTMTVVLNAADEMAVHAFLSNSIPFTAIAERIERLMQLHQDDLVQTPSLDEIVSADAWARSMFAKLQNQSATVLSP